MYSVGHIISCITLQIKIFMMHATLRKVAVFFMLISLSRSVPAQFQVSISHMGAGTTVLDEETIYSKEPGSINLAFTAIPEPSAITFGHLGVLVAGGLRGAFFN